MSKRLVYNNTSLIHLDQLEQRHIIVPKKDGKPLGMIFYQDDYWNFYGDMNTMMKFELKTILKDERFNFCEFDVLE